MSTSGIPRKSTLWRVIAWLLVGLFLALLIFLTMVVRGVTIEEGQFGLQLCAAAIVLGFVWGVVRFIWGLIRYRRWAKAVNAFPVG